MPRDISLPQQVIDPHGILDRLRAGDPTLKMLRQSTIGSFDICMRRAGYDMRPNQPRRSGEARCVGTAYHGGLEEAYRSRTNEAFPATLDNVKRAAQEAFEAEAALFDAWATSKEASWQRVTDMLDVYFNNEHYWSQRYEVLGVEQEFFLPLTNNWFLKGSIDLVLRQPDDGRVILVDHKTAGRKWKKNKHLPEKQVQAVIYCWAWWMATGEIPDHFSFDVMTYKGEFERRECKVEPRHMRAVLDKAVGVARVFDAVPGDVLPGNPSSDLCSGLYCDHFLICPMGAALLTTVDVSVPTLTPTVET